MGENRKKENFWVLILVVIILALLIFSVDTSPLWIYQGF
jgi:preprotein translocase subunit SecE